MGTRAARALAAAAAALALTGSAAASPPEAGTLVPGERLGGIQIGMTKQEVRRAWGSRFGRCRGCPRETWYFNYRPFDPVGAGVAFAKRRVVQVFTLWQPEGWRTSRGLVLGAPEAQVTRRYPAALRESCGRYSALVLFGRRAQTAFYLHEGELWGFGLSKPGTTPCL